jgi:hypothetical protein
LAAALLIKGELATGREEVEQALRLTPDSLVYLEMIGWLLTLYGEWQRGPALTRTALERNPHCLPHASFGLWVDHLRRGELELAHRAALAYRDTAFFWRPLMHAVCLGHLGLVGEAKVRLAELLSRKPDFPARGRALIGHFIKFPEAMDPILEGLRRAGLELDLTLHSGGGGRGRWIACRKRQEELTSRPGPRVRADPMTGSGKE